MLKVQKQTGFTIVELLIVVVVIAILAAITIVAYNGISNRAKESALKSDLKSGATQLQVAKETDGAYPGDASGLKKSDSTTFTYSTVAGIFCLGGTSSELAGSSFHITQSGTIQEGVCPTPAIQVITAANCPSSRTLVRDARDNHTYWIQELSDGKCWMLTNLAYAGGGTNTYGDTKTLTNGTGGSTAYTSANYYIPTNANVTTEPTQPSTSTDGGATNPQYGYLYNWCAAMGNQQGTDACSGTDTTDVNTAISVCPAGWRLPTAEPISGDFTALNNAVNGGSTSSDVGLLAAPWLGQIGGRWAGSFALQGYYSYYWSSSQYSATNARNLVFQSGYVGTSETGFQKYYGFAVRCVAI